MDDGPRHHALLHWYAGHGRDLPWRRTRDPYRILVSEVMLQQTQVERVIGYYERFLAAFPDAAALAAAPRDAVHRLWKGLGYPSRADRLQAACAQVVADGGRWPDTAETLQALPGIGPYTAAAVACFAFGRGGGVVDTNIARIYCRLQALPAEPPLLRAAVAADWSQREPIAWGNALMDLGATICTARRPGCGSCPWRAGCAARDDAERQALTAAPLKAAVSKQRYGVVPQRGRPRLHIVLALIHDDAGRYLLARRREDARDLPSAWELPGGKRESGEDDRTALAREIREELGAEILAARPFVDYGDGYRCFHVYRCRLFDPGAVQPLASSTLRWATPEEFLATELPSANEPIRQRFRRYHRLD
jgi:A/G-specific adenine glycosylase